MQFLIYLYAKSSLLKIRNVKNMREHQCQCKQRQIWFINIFVRYDTYFCKKITTIETNKVYKIKLLFKYDFGNLNVAYLCSIFQQNNLNK